MGTRSLRSLNNTSKTLAAGSTTEIHIEPMIPIRPANSRSNASTDLVSYYRDVRMMQENARRTQQRHSHSMNPSSSGGTVKYPRTHSIPSTLGRPSVGATLHAPLKPIQSHRLDTQPKFSDKASHPVSMTSTHGHAWLGLIIRPPCEPNRSRYTRHPNQSPWQIHALVLLSKHGLA